MTEYDVNSLRTYAEGETGSFTVLPTSHTPPTKQTTPMPTDPNHPKIKDP